MDKQIKKTIDDWQSISSTKAESCIRFATMMEAEIAECGSYSSWRRRPANTNLINELLKTGLITSKDANLFKNNRMLVNYWLEFMSDPSEAWMTLFINSILELTEEKSDERPQGEIIGLLPQPCYLNIDQARILACVNENGSVNKTNLFGRNAVIKINDIYFKSLIIQEGDSKPFNERATYYLAYCLTNRVLTPPSRYFVIKIPGLAPIRMQASLAINGEHFEAWLKLRSTLEILNSKMSSDDILDMVTTILNEPELESIAVDEHLLNQVNRDFLALIESLTIEERPLNFDRKTRIQKERIYINFLLDMKIDPRRSIAFLSENKNLMKDQTIENILPIQSTLYKIKDLHPNVDRDQIQTIITSAKNLTQCVKPEKLDWIFILSLISNQRDWSGTNILLYNTGIVDASGLVLDIVPIDNDLSFVNDFTFTHDQEGASLFAIMSIMPALYHQLNRPLHPVVIERLRTINIDSFIISWLSYLSKEQHLYTSACRHESEKIDTSFLKHQVDQIKWRLESIKALIETNPNPNHEQIFSCAHPIAFSIYSSLTREHHDPLTVLSIFDQHSGQLNISEIVRLMPDLSVNIVRGFNSTLSAESFQELLLDYMIKNNLFGSLEDRIQYIVINQLISSNVNLIQFKDHFVISADLMTRIHRDRPNFLFPWISLNYEMIMIRIGNDLYPLNQVSYEGYINIINSVNDPEILFSIFSRLGLDLNQTDCNGDNLLISSARLNSAGSLIYSLCQVINDIDAINCTNESALEMTIDNENKENAGILLAHSAGYSDSNQRAEKIFQKLENLKWTHESHLYLANNRDFLSNKIEQNLYRLSFSEIYQKNPGLLAGDARELTDFSVAQFSVNATIKPYPEMLISVWILNKLVGIIFNKKPASRFHREDFSDLSVPGYSKPSFAMPVLIEYEMPFSMDLYEYMRKTECSRVKSHVDFDSFIATGIVCALLPINEQVKAHISVTRNKKRGIWTDSFHVFFANNKKNEQSYDPIDLLCSLHYMNEKTVGVETLCYRLNIIIESKLTELLEKLKKELTAQKQASFTKKELNKSRNDRYYQEQLDQLKEFERQLKDKYLIRLKLISHILSQNKPISTLDLVQYVDPVWLCCMKISILSLCKHPS